MNGSLSEFDCPLAELTTGRVGGSEPVKGVMGQLVVPHDRPIHIDGMFKTSLWARLSGKKRSLE